ncbi:hypothetical protein B0H16DRAFT_1621106 [Mycena metata]|uniref:Uncharacterized protein n=1 Tax=Mycena metata TaxID=1033252 RepID=A0AAD7MEE4_9AGAR|nr:hypothetical protein B0H16DRAFT_1621106 [Mycena metata]
MQNEHARTHACARRRTQRCGRVKEERRVDNEHLSSCTRAQTPWSRSMRTRAQHCARHRHRRQRIAPPHSRSRQRCVPFLPTKHPPHSRFPLPTPLPTSQQTQKQLTRQPHTSLLENAVSHAHGQPDHQGVVHVGDEEEEAREEKVVGGGGDGDEVAWKQTHQFSCHSRREGRREGWGKREWRGKERGGMGQSRRWWGRCGQGREVT